jgi:hypothetical protein
LPRIHLTLTEYSTDVRLLLSQLKLPQATETP